MTIRTDKPLDYTSQVWRGIDDKFPKKIHNATTTSDGLMSAEDKAKLDSIDVQGHNQIYDVATWESDGLMSKEDKKKMDGIEDNANNYIHPNTPEIRHVTDEQIAYWNAKASTDVATHEINGLMSAEDKAKLDLVDTDVCNITYDRVTHDKDGLMSFEDKIKLDELGRATHDKDGLMSIEDKIKLDGIEEGANNYIHPNNEGIRHVSDAEKDYWNSKADKDIVTNAENGLMSYIDKIKLDGIEEGANNYIHPNTPDMRHVTDEQIRIWNTPATVTSNGLLSKEDKQLLVKLNDTYSDLIDSDSFSELLERMNKIEENLSAISDISELVERIDTLEQTLQRAIFYK